MKTSYEDVYRVSARVVLLPGDQFRVAGGPYWRLGGGVKVPLATRGVCTFRRTIRRGRVVCLEATAKDGAVILHVEGRRRNRLMPALVCRPYAVKSKVRRKSKASG